MNVIDTAVALRCILSSWGLFESTGPTSGIAQLESHDFSLDGVFDYESKGVDCYWRKGTQSRPSTSQLVEDVMP